MAQRDARLVATTVLHHVTQLVLGHHLVVVAPTAVALVRHPAAVVAHQGVRHLVVARVAVDVRQGVPLAVAVDVRQGVPLAVVVVAGLVVRERILDLVMVVIQDVI